MGRKATPTTLKKLHGNPGRRRISAAEPQGQGELWAPPQWFDDEQRAQWHYALENAPVGLLSGTDREVLAVWVVACVEHARAAVQVRRTGQLVKSKEGVFYQSPFVSIMNKQAMVMLKAGSEMGFSPAARASLGARAPEFTPPPGAGARQPRGGGLAGYLENKPDRLN